MTKTITQDVLKDVSRTGKERPWTAHRISCEYLAAAYDDIDESKADRVRGCATELGFKIGEGGMTLARAWFCRVRLCPMCTWRRSLKVAAQVTQIMDEIKKEHDYKYILLTLTQKNCPGEELAQRLDELMKAYDRLFHRKRIKDASQGWYRAVEITHNLEDDTYHPHIHAVIAVPAGYFSGGRYINQADWTDMWQQSLKVSYTPIVDVRKVKGNTAAAVAEVAKYAVKSKDYIIPDDWDLTQKTITLLDEVLANRRFVGYGGIFKDMQRKLKLKDPEEDGDLLHIDEESTGEAEDKLLSFVWYSGFRQYHKE